jgi:hypothetical protein
VTVGFRQAMAANETFALKIDFNHLHMYMLIHMYVDVDQGCQIFLDAIYQNDGKYTKLPQHYRIAIKYTK